MKVFFKDEDGAVMLIVAFSMSVLIAMMALVLDIGSLYLEKNRLQKTVDAAALAGAQELPQHFSKAREEAVKTIKFNNGDPSHFLVRTNDTNTMIEVTGSRQGTLFFAKALGISEPMIQASALIQLHPIKSGKGAIPLGIQPSQKLEFGSLQTLKVSDAAHGNFGAIALTGSGSRNFEDDLREGYRDELKIGAVLNTETGRMAGPTERAVNSRISRCPNATYLSHPPDCSRIVLIPIYEPVQTSQNQIRQVRVVGFASFFLEHVSSTSEGAEVTGRFIKFSQSGESSPNQADFGTYGFKLIQ